MPDSERRHERKIADTGEVFTGVVKVGEPDIKAVLASAEQTERKHTG
jgi:hypothetical protein